MALTPLSTAQQPSIQHRLPQSIGKKDGSMRSAADPFLRKSLQHFRWPLLPGVGEKQPTNGALAPVLDVLRPARPERNALLPQHNRAQSQHLLGALADYQQGLPEGSEMAELARDLHARVMDETAQRQQFDSWRCAASPC